jgi:hypothetical protein
MTKTSTEITWPLTTTETGSDAANARALCAYAV